MTRAEYIAYLQSSYWEQLKGKVHEANLGGGCRTCGSFDYLEVHHRTYERVPYNEKLYDMTVLCHECHELFHNRVKDAPNDWAHETRSKLLYVQRNMNDMINEITDKLPARATAAGEKNLNDILAGLLPSPPSETRVRKPRPRD